MLFPLPSRLPKRNSVRQVDAALQLGALWNTALDLRRIAGAAAAQLRSAVLARSCLGQSFQLSFNCIGRVSDLPHRFRKPFLRYIEFVGPVLDFMGLKQADSASILRTPVGEIIWHTFSPSKATRWGVGQFPVTLSPSAMSRYRKARIWIIRLGSRQWLRQGANILDK